jgi:hypothetical protein
MKQYLKDLPNKPHKHKKRFALITSGVFTLAMFSVWSFVMFGQEPELASETGPVNLAAASTAEVTPFENILDGLKESIQSITGLIRDGE